MTTLLLDVEVSLEQQVHTHHKPYGFQVREGRRRCLHLTRPGRAARLTRGSHMLRLLIAVLRPQLQNCPQHERHSL
jgi:hypothetical protein